MAWNPELLSKYEEEMAEKRRRQEAAACQADSENEIASLRAQNRRLQAKPVVTKELRAVLLWWFGTTDPQMINEHCAKWASEKCPDVDYIVSRTPPADAEARVG